MRWKLFVYIVAFIPLILVLLVFSNAYRQFTSYSDLIHRENIVHSGFQHLAQQLNNAAVANPELITATSSLSRGSELFYSDSQTVFAQLDLLKSTNADSINEQIITHLDSLVRAELSWILNSNVPDSIIHRNSREHITAFQHIDSLLKTGSARTIFLVAHHQKMLGQKVTWIKIWMAVFIVLSGLLLFYTLSQLFKQHTKREGKEKELVTVFNRISDGVVSVNRDWQYTFLNEAALATHPLGLKETLGKIIWDIHPQMKGTIFWDRYHEAMETGKVMEIEDYYKPMDIWFSVKVYPSSDGLTIFYRNVTESKKAEQKLANTLREISDYKVALDESSIVAITDQMGRITYVNDYFCNLSKYSREELIGQDHRILNSGYHPKEFIRSIWVTIANGEIWKGELRNKAKDGTIYWVDTTIVPFLDDKGKPYRYVAIRADITERKLTEQKLAASERHFRSLIENSVEGIALADEYSNTIYRSPAATKIMGELPTQNSINRTHPDDLELLKKLHLQVLKHPEVPFPFQARFLNASGQYLWLEGVFTNMLHIKEVNAIVTNFRDVSERKASEEKLIKSERVYKTIASSIPGSVICLLDSDFRYLLIEGDILEKLGYSKEKLLGKTAKDVLPEEAFREYEPDFKEAFSGVTVTKEFNRNGYDLISKFIPLMDEDRRVYNIMTVSIDVTKLKNAQRYVAELNRNLEEKIAVRTEELRKTNQDLEAFSYSVSHDLRAPLRGIIAFAKILEEEYSSKLDDEAKRITSIIRDSTLKMGDLIDDLLAFSRMGKLGITKVYVNTNLLVQQIKQEQDKLNKHGNSITWNIHELAPVRADINTLRQVWINLISNAVKYSRNREHPHIEIGSYLENGQAVFYIRDNGAGFDEEYIDKLFKVFQRLHDADDFEGTGIGLALVEKIVSRHDGKVWAKGKEGEGACFYFSLP